MKNLLTKNHKAFTLSEALVTLAIIGVIAMLVMPSLTTYFRNKIWSTSDSAFKNKFENAIQDMHTQDTLGGHPNTMSFVNELAKNYRINKICTSDKITSCFEDKVYWGTEKEEIDMTKIKNAKNFGWDDWGTETVGLMFANGVTGVVAYNPDCDFDNNSDEANISDCLALLYDVDGFKLPNTQSKDLRSINVKSLGSNCAFEINGTCFTAPFFPDPLTIAECEALKGDLGIKECYHETDYAYWPDYWAGAVKACGGVSKMATLAQLADIANYVYNTSGIGAKDDMYDEAVDLTLDYDKVAELGFTASQGYPFTVWSSDEYDNDHTHTRIFRPTETYTLSDFRNTSNRQAVCIGD